VINILGPQVLVEAIKSRHITSLFCLRNASILYHVFLRQFSGNMLYDSLR